MNNNFKQKLKVIGKKAVFALIPLLILLIVAETSARVVYYEKAGKNKGHFALQAIYKQVKFMVLAKKAQQALGAFPKDKDIFAMLYTQMGQPLLTYFQNQYEQGLSQLVYQAQKIKAKVLVLYLPSTRNPNAAYPQTNRQFFAGLAAKYQVDYLDLTNALAKYQEQQITLLPQNDHYSRFGNQLVAQELAKYLEKNNEYKSEFVFDKSPKVLGDLSPNENTVWEYDPSMPYRVKVNNQGFRMNYDLEFPKQKQRVLVLGDSFTFGPYLDNHDTYPALLNQIFPNKEVINGGVAGYTITDETSLFLDRAQYSQPDIIILQVLDNDITDLFSFKRNQFNRQKINIFPSKVEQDFFHQLSQ